MAKATTVQNAIKAELEKRGWSKYRLAKEVGVNPGDIYRQLDNPQTSLAKVEKMLEALGAHLTFSPNSSSPKVKASA